MCSRGHTSIVGPCASSTGKVELEAEPRRGDARRQIEAPIQDMRPGPALRGHGRLRPFRRSGVRRCDDRSSRAPL